jgi:hypothetical protein
MITWNCNVALFINTGINDTAYYWNELVKCIKVYAKKRKPNIGQLKYWWRFPIKIHWHSNTIIST